MKTFTILTPDKIRLPETKLIIFSVEKESHLHSTCNLKFQ